jgi:SnoaL-like domain
MGIAAQSAQEVEQLIYTGFHLVDTGKIGTWSPNTDDFEMVLPNVTLTGEQYAQFVARRAQATYTTRHLVSNVRHLDGDDDSHTVAYVVTAHRLEEGASGPTVMVADFVDTWVRVDDEWRHQRREITPAFGQIGG